METIKLTVGESKSKGFKPVSWLIQLVERTDHSHVFISWKCANLGVRKVAEARGSGGRLISNYEFKRTNTVVRGHVYEIDSDTLFKVEKFLWENTRGYAYKQIVGILIMRILKIFGIKISNPFKDGKRSMICAEHVVRVIEIIKGIDLEEEDYGMVETHKLNIKYRDYGIPQEKIDQINSRK